VAVGDVHRFGDYQYQETTFGPMVPGRCVDCGTQVFVVAPTGRVNEWGLPEDQGIAEPRCSRDGRTHYGAVQTKATRPTRETTP
jgi:hypothetical protein